MATRSKRLYSGMALAWVMLALGFVFAAPSAHAQAARISGTITYRERVTLPANAVVTVRILQRQATPGADIVLGAENIPSNGKQVPLDWEVRYDQSAVKQNETYVLDAYIHIGNQRRFTLRDNVEVITKGRPTVNIHLVLGAVNLPHTSGGTTPLVVAGLLLAGAAAFQVMRWQRNRQADVASRQA